MSTPPPTADFPFIPHPLAAQVLEVARQLRRFESLPSGEQARIQARQCLSLLRHAHAWSPFWRERLTAAGFDPAEDDLGVLANLPPLQRQDLQTHFADLRARLPGQEEGDFSVATTSGSTGQPVRVEKQHLLYGMLYEAISLIDSEWHGRDPSQTLAVLGIGIQEAIAPDWGGIFPQLGYHGRGVGRGLSTHTMASHLDWLQTHRPSYLKCGAMAAAELARMALDAGLQLPIRQIMSQSERVLPRHRQLCREAFGAEIKDRYSCEETGWLALQCPRHDHLHVMSGTTLLEIVDDQDRPCGVGQPGRVLITSLHSYAMPIIRYELGDIAEWGPPCDCGMTLPVLGRLWGRTRHQLILPSGERRLVPLIGDDIGTVEAVREFQIRQYRGGELEILCRTSRPLSPAERERITAILHTDVTADLPVFVREVPAIDWGSSGKREEFIRVEADYG